MNPHYPSIASRAGHRCEYCRAPEAIFNAAFEVEHITPVSRGGSDQNSNLALSCRACNVFKADHVSGVDETTKDEVALFHPRYDRWEEHFEIEAATGAIVGITSVGRATVARLQMNSDFQREARLLWMQLGIFP